MKTLHIPYCFYPDPVGGTEVYVESLAKHLKQAGIQSVIAAPGDQLRSYKHDGLRVRRFSTNGAPPALREIYGGGDASAVEQFAQTLQEEQPDVVHFHALTRGVSVRLIREAKRRAIPVVFTYHTPTVSCPRGTLLRWGTEICNGLMDVRLCSRCTLHGLGLGKAASTVVGSLPPAIGRLMGASNLSGGVWTALRMTELIALRHETVRTAMQLADRVVALCAWVKELLERNGVPAEKMVVSRHGLAQTAAPADHRAPAKIGTDEGPLRIAFLGRLHPTKGPDVLLRAFQLAPDLSAALHLFCIVQGEAGGDYQRTLKETAGCDPRVTFRPPVPGDQVISLLRDYDLLAVPSQWLETGPLVVLEAFAAGIPVIGSDLGGIAEMVTHQVDGLLLPRDEPGAWARTIRTLANDRGRLARLHAGVRPPRTMAAVAAEMQHLYSSIR